jgi:hypothetical protein
MTAHERRTARQRARIGEPVAPNTTDIYTTRQQIADETDPGLRRHLISENWSKLRANGLSPGEAADRLGVDVDECRRAHNAVQASYRRLTA